MQAIVKVLAANKVYVTSKVKVTAFKNSTSDILFLLFWMS